MKRALLSLGAVIFLACARHTLIPYNLNEPTTVLVLPDTLREISDISMIDSNRIACIQDENGILFIVNARDGKIEKQLTFAPNGDYEGIAVVKENIYVLRSDGFLYQIKNFTSDKPQINSFATGVPAKNN